MTRTRVKICGITRVADALAAADAGADAIGVVLAPSPRRVTIDVAQQIVAALPPLVSIWGVFLNASESEIRAAAAAIPLDRVQLHGDEPPELCRALMGGPRPLRIVKRLKPPTRDEAESLCQQAARFAGCAILIDPGAGDGKTFDWKLARGLPGPIIVSGGLCAANVAAAIAALRPYAVDVSSGVESSPGVKDAARVSAFIEAVRQADGEHH